MNGTLDSTECLKRNDPLKNIHILKSLHTIFVYFSSFEPLTPEVFNVT